MTISNSSKSAASDDGWRAESDLRMLIEAEKIKSDKSRMRAALAKRDEMRECLTGVGRGMRRKY